jgi:ubiquinone/menaquinone biosynthesis C-methylase UbiE
LTNFLGIYYVISIILVTTVMVIAKFIVFDRVIFNENIYYEQMKGGNYYNKHKSNNPVVILLMRLFHNDLFKYIEAIKPKTLLDIGCGEGFTTMEIIKKFPMINVEMREYDPEMVGKAKQLHGSLQVKHGDITFIKEPNNSYDLVLATEVLEHLETPLKAIEELKRVSCRYVLITVPNEPYWRIANILRGSYLASLGNTPGHIQHWTKNQLRNLLRRYFKKVKIKTSTLWNIALCEK